MSLIHLLFFCKGSLFTTMIRIETIIKQSFLLWIMCCLLTACNQDLNRRLDRVEEIISSDPYTAYAELTEIPSSMLRTSSHQARYALLMSLALDKSYIDVKDDSLVQIAVRYYQDGKNASYKMLSFYSLGIVQRNANNTTAAIISFLNSKKIAAERADYHYLGLINRNIASLYRMCHDVDQELFYCQESVSAFDKEDAPLYSAYSRLEEARAFMAKGLYFHADSVFRKVEAFARDNDKQLLRQVLMDRAINVMSGRPQEAKQAIAFYKEADEIAGGKKETSDYGKLAQAYDILNDPDSVARYVSLAKSSVKSSLDSVHLCNTLAYLYTSHGDYKSANEQYQKGVMIHNQMVFDQENLRIAKAISDYSQEEAASQEEVARHRLGLLILSIVGILALLIIIIQLIIIRRRQLQEKNRIILEKEQKIEEEMAQIQEIAEELQSSRSGRTELAEIINGLIQDKIAIVKMCADAYEAVKNEPKSKDPYRYLDVDPIKQKTEQMQKFLNALELFRKDDSLFSLLENSVNAAQSDIMIHLRDVCSKNKMEKPQFEEEDFRILMLFYAGIPDRTIAFLMDMSCAAVRTRKTRYKDRLMRPDISGGAYFVQQISCFR